MKKTIKIALTSFFIFAFCLTTSAAQFNIGVDAGQLSFDSNFDSAMTYGGKVSFISKEGLMIEALASYAEVDSNTTRASSFKMAPALIGLSYHLRAIPLFKPYAGIVGGFSLLSSVYETPALTYGFKAGTFIKLGKETNIYLEASKLYVDADETIDIAPLKVVAGLSISMGGNWLKKNRASDPLEFKPVRK